MMVGAKGCPDVPAGDTMSEDEATRREFVAAAGAAMVGGLAGCAAVEPPSQTPGEEPLVAQSRAAEEDRFVSLYEAVRDSVVELRVAIPDNPFEDAGGSGFFIDDGTIVTNAHVVFDRDRVDVRYADDSWDEGTVIGLDIHSDLAVIETDEGFAEAQPLAFVDDFPQIGEEAMAIGSPLGFSASATTGIVSGVNRSLPTETGFAVPAAIQTDAGVNPGNSGGPLVNLAGSVMGVVFAGAGQNLGFAISAPLATRVVPMLQQGEEFEHSYMGTHLVEVSPRLAAANDLPDARGVYVHEVLPEGPADGVLNGSTGQTTMDGQPVPTGGDVILTMDDQPIDHMDQLSGFLALETDPGDVITLTLSRDDTERTVDLELGTRPDSPMEL